MRKLKEKKGSSIVELIVAFVVLMFLVGMFFQIVRTSYQMINKSVDIRTNIEDFYSRYYEYEAGVGGVGISEELSDSGGLTLNAEDGTSLKLKNSDIIEVTDSDSSISIFAFRTPESKVTE